MAIFSPSLKGLFSLLLECEQYCAEWDICLDAKKSRCPYFGKQANISYELMLNENIVEWAEELPYLGVTLKSGKTFNCSVTARIKKYYRSINNILRIEGYSNDLVLSQLIDTHCLPIWTHAIEIIHVSYRDERRQLRVAYNSVFRKIFNYRWSESVSALQRFLGVRCQVSGGAKAGSQARKGAGWGISGVHGKESGGVDCLEAHNSR